MKLGIMQPYFFPYIGYFQLMSAVDEFVVYDNIQYSKKGWINRNRILVGGKDVMIILPLKKGSDYADVKDRTLADSWPRERTKLLNRIRESYRKAPHFGSAFPVVEQAVQHKEENLFAFIVHSLNLVRAYLDIQTPLIVSSTIPIDHALKAEKKVMAICKTRHTDTYINPIGGLELYDRASFKQQGIELRFIKTSDFQYPQFGNDFIPFLSIIDVMMFNSRENIQTMLHSQYSFV